MLVIWSKKRLALSCKIVVVLEISSIPVWILNTCIMPWSTSFLPSLQIPSPESADILVLARKDYDKSVASQYTTFETFQIKRSFYSVYHSHQGPNACFLTCCTVYKLMHIYLLLSNGGTISVTEKTSIRQWYAWQRSRGTGCARTHGYQTL